MVLAEDLVLCLFRFCVLFLSMSIARCICCTVMQGGLKTSVKIKPGVLWFCGVAFMGLVVAPAGRRVGERPGSGIFGRMEGELRAICSMLTVVRLATAISLSLGLGGCLRPVYAPSGGFELRGELQAIAVEPVQGRLGHYMTEELRFLLNGTGDQPVPKYRLVITFSQSGQTSLVDTVTGRATANSLSVRADYKLVPASGGAPVTEGYVISLADYDRASNRFANVRAARDAEIRNGKTLADQIRTRIAAALSPQ
jgi:LPS-assembly lipoprotein